MSDKKSINNFVQVVAEKYKTIDVLINNAGVARKGDEFNEEVATWTFATVIYFYKLRISMVLLTLLMLC